MSTLSFHPNLPAKSIHKFLTKCQPKSNTLIVLPNPSIQIKQFANVLFTNATGIVPDCEYIIILVFLRRNVHFKFPPKSSRQVYSQVSYKVPAQIQHPYRPS